MTSPPVGELRRPRWPWPLAWVLVTLYICAYAGMIRQYKAIPYWDQSGYVLKTYSLVEQWNVAGVARPWWHRILSRMKPDLYLDAPPALRPPLLETIPALLFRHHATPHEMAYTWLLCRIAFLMAGAWVLALHVGDARWVPAAIALTLASQGFLKLNQNLYLMDVPFACCALLSVALVARAMRVRTMRACLLAGAATVALLLIKPQALAFMFPFYAFLVIERLVHEWRTWCASAKGWTHRIRQLLPLLRWKFALLLLLLAIGYLLQSSYGQAAAAQYTLNTQGFWAHAIDGQYLVAILSGLAAPWMLVFALVAWIWNRKRPQPTAIRGFPKLAAFALLAAAWWICFNLFLSFGIDPRLVWSIAPLIVCIISMTAWRIPVIGRIATTVAILWFIAALCVTVGIGPFRELSGPIAVLGPPIQYQQRHAEIGLVPFIDECSRVVHTATPAARETWIEVMACDELVEADALNLAARRQNHDKPSSIHYQAAPWGQDGFDLADTFNGSQSGWYATKTRRPTAALNPSAFVNLLAIHALITDPQSPIHALFDECSIAPLEQPVNAETGLFSHGTENDFLNDSLLLWHLRRPLNPQECRDAAAFILSRFTSPVGIARMRDQLSTFERMAKQGTSVTVIPESALPPPDQSPIHNVPFQGDLLLRAARLSPAPGGGLLVTLYWQATADVDLINTRFFHLNDEKGNILRQADALQDPFRGHIHAGTLWSDTTTLSAEQLQDVASVGIGIVYPDGKLAQITPTPPATLDWKNQRLILSTHP